MLQQTLRTVVLVCELAVCLASSILSISGLKPFLLIIFQPKITFYPVLPLLACILLFCRYGNLRLMDLTFNLQGVPLTCDGKEVVK